MTRLTKLIVIILAVAFLLPTLAMAAVVPTEGVWEAYEVEMDVSGNTGAYVWAKWEVFDATRWQYTYWIQSESTALYPTTGFDGHDIHSFTFNLWGFDSGPQPAAMFTGTTGWYDYSAFGMDPYMYLVFTDPILSGTNSAEFNVLSTSGPELDIGAMSNLIGGAALDDLLTGEIDGTPGGGTVPEPGTLLLIGSGLLGLALARSRK